MSAQTPSIRACGIKGSRECQCIKHVEKVQEEHMDACMASAPESSIREARQRCMKEMPLHCGIVEHYGNWSTDESGEHNAPMPQQCTSACRLGHCHCADGPTCHFAHSPEQDSIFK